MLRVYTHDSRFTDFLPGGIGKKNVHHGIHGQAYAASAKEAAQADIFGHRDDIKSIPLGVLAAQLQRDCKVHAHLPAPFFSFTADEFGQAHAQQIKINGLLEIRGHTEVSAKLFGFRTGFAADDDNGD
jgi:hypothetical protein